MGRAQLHRVISRQGGLARQRVHRLSPRDTGNAFHGKAGDLLIQQALHQVLSPVFETGFSDCFLQMWAAFLAEDKSARSSTSICLKIKDPLFTALSADDQNLHLKSIVSTLEKEGAAYDIGAYRDAPVGLRIWGGATVETSDIQALLPWLDWAYSQARAALAA